MTDSVTASAGLCGICGLFGEPPSRSSSTPLHKMQTFRGFPTRPPTGLKIQWWQHRVGSSPTSGTPIKPGPEIRCSSWSVTDGVTAPADQGSRVGMFGESSGILFTASTLASKSLRQDRESSRTGPEIQWRQYRRARVPVPRGLRCSQGHDVLLEAGQLEGSLGRKWHLAGGDVAVRSCAGARRAVSFLR